MHLYTCSTVRMHIDIHTCTQTHTHTHIYIYIYIYMSYDDPDNFKWTYIVIDETLYTTNIDQYH
jgi:hypothetical protein